jgi:hypothetical protein
MAVTIETTSVIAANEIDVQISPNPSSGEFKLSIGKVENATVKVIDGLGNVIFSKQINSGQSIIDLTTIGKGLYQLYITTSKGIVVKKVVVQ